MRRKIIKQGYDTLTITLPSKWTKKFHLKPGDEVELVEHDRMLQISTEKGPSLSGITIDISGLSASVIWRHILSAYRAGYDEIIIKGLGKSKKNGVFSLKTSMDYMNNKEFSVTSPTNIIQFETSSVMRKPYDLGKTMSPVEIVSACVNRLIGMEIIEQKEEYCKIKELSETTYKEFDNALRRIFLLLRLESEYIENALKGDKRDLKEIFTVDTNLDRFEDFCLRVLNKKGYTEYRKTSAIYCIVFMLELIGDELKKIGQHILLDKKTYSKSVIEIFSKQIAQMNRLYDLFYRFDKRKSEEIYAEDRNVENMINARFKSLNDAEKELVHHFKKIGIFVLNLTELTIDISV
ncbi:MAG: AbrB/MazE/SpoVT family DNA-binding domain-containing protein [Candidatus Aenigmatarchaeota archaeon]